MEQQFVCSAAARRYFESCANGEFIIGNKFCCIIGEQANNVAPEVIKYSTRKLAQNLYDCVSCEEPRQDIDWFVAENFFKENPGIILSMSMRLMVIKSFEALTNNPRFQLSRNLINCFNEGWREYINFIKILSQISEERLIEVVLKARSLCDYQGMDLCLGRMVWQNGYQLIKARLSPPYGEIKFH